LSVYIRHLSFLKRRLIIAYKLILLYRVAVSIVRRMLNIT
jgi:hypothetical protein